MAGIVCASRDLTLHILFTTSCWQLQQSTSNRHISIFLELAARGRKQDVQNLTKMLCTAFYPAPWYHFGGSVAQLKSLKKGDDYMLIKWFLLFVSKQIEDQETDSAFQKKIAFTSIVMLCVLVYTTKKDKWLYYGSRSADDPVDPYSVCVVRVWSGWAAPPILCKVADGSVTYAHAHILTSTCSCTCILCTTHYTYMQYMYLHVESTTHMNKDLRQHHNLPSWLTKSWLYVQCMGPRISSRYEMTQPGTKYM